MPTSRRAIILLLAGTIAAGCASGKGAGPRAAGPPPEAAADYFPLAQGWKWAYEVDKSGERILATYAVLETLLDTVIVQAGEERIVYATLPEGVARRQGATIGDFLIKTPVRKGAEWPIEGGSARIEEVGKTITVPAGTFVNCAVVVETRANPSRVVRTSYAPGVGAVSIEMQVSEPGARPETALRAVLLGVTRPGEDPLGPAEPTGAAAK